MRNLQPHEIIDLFISDCILPSTKKVLKAAEIYKIFEAYCEQLQIGTPCSLIHFGKCMSKRFQKKATNGKSYYFCEIKPDILGENPDGAIQKAD